MPGYRVAKSGDSEVWMRKLEDGSVAVGLFNRSGVKTVVNAEWKDLGLSGKYKVRDLWRQKDLGEFDNSFSREVNGKGVVMIKIMPL